MQPESQHYLEERLQSLDDDFLLTRAFLPAAMRPRTAALYALRAEFRLLPMTVRDDDVALAKLGWWAEEWQRLMDAAPRHPITVALAECYPAFNERGHWPSLADALNALAEVIGAGSWENVAAMRDCATRLAQPLALLESGQHRDVDAGRNIAKGHVLNVGVPERVVFVRVDRREPKAEAGVTCVHLADRQDYFIQFAPGRCREHRRRA